MDDVQKIKALCDALMDMKQCDFEELGDCFYDCPTEVRKMAEILLRNGIQAVAKDDQ